MNDIDRLATAWLYVSEAIGAEHAMLELRDYLDAEVRQHDRKYPDGSIFIHGPSHRARASLDTLMLAIARVFAVDAARGELG